MKRTIILILVMLLLAGTFACAKPNDSENDFKPPINIKTPSPDSPTPKVSQTPIGISTLTPIPTSDPDAKDGKAASTKMEPVLISLAYASRFYDYSKDDADFIWCAVAYLASTYGYEVVDAKNPQPTLILSEDQVQTILNAFFGDNQASVKKIKLNTEFFTVNNNTYTCVKKFDYDSEFKIEKIKIKGGDHIVSIMETNMDGKNLTSSVFVLNVAEFDSPYPQYVTKLEYTELGRR